MNDSSTSGSFADSLLRAQEALRACATNDPAERRALDGLIARLDAARRGGTSVDEREGADLLGEFASIVGHELRGTLQPIVLFVELALVWVTRDAMPPKEQLVPRLEAFRRQLARANDDLARLLDFTRLRSGRVELRLEEVDLVTSLREAIDAQQLDIQHARCTVTMDAPARVTGRWDRLRVQQIVGNLLSNAIKFGAGGSVELDVTCPPGLVRLAVRDHGPGIAPEQRPLVFTRFERAAATRHQPGYGVGLWVVARLVDALGGTVAIESTPGGGATFVVTLPRESHD